MTFIFMAARWMNSTSSARRSLSATACERPRRPGSAPRCAGSEPKPSPPLLLLPLPSPAAYGSAIVAGGAADVSAAQGEAGAGCARCCCHCDIVS
jgi:hypothetical protein